MATLPSGTVTLMCDLGEHRLKDFAEPVRLFQLGAGSFPPFFSDIEGSTRLLEQLGAEGYPGRACGASATDARGVCTL